MLTSTKINSLKPKEKPNKMADAHGLYIDVRPIGAKFWRQKYRATKVEKLLSHGKYPLVSLAEARKFRDEAIKSLSQGIDPSKAKRQAKARLVKSLWNGLIRSLSTGSQYIRIRYGDKWRPVYYRT